VFSSKGEVRGWSMRRPRAAVGKLANLIEAGAIASEFKR
jgi:hypothetical protein